MAANWHNFAEQLRVGRVSRRGQTDELRLPSSTPRKVQTVRCLEISGTLQD
jgi:hypothetical protein